MPGTHSRPSRRLLKALREVEAKPHQIKMAAILLGVNGIDNALEFVYGLQARGLTLIEQHNDRPI